MRRSCQEARKALHLAFNCRGGPRLWIGACSWPKADISLMIRSIYQSPDSIAMASFTVARGRQRERNEGIPRLNTAHLPPLTSMKAPVA